MEIIKAIVTRYLNLVFMNLHRINKMTPERKLLFDDSSLTNEKRSDSSDHLDFDLSDTFDGFDGVFHLL